MKVDDELKEHWGGLLQPLFPTLFPNGAHFRIDSTVSDFRAEVS